MIKEEEFTDWYTHYRELGPTDNAIANAEHLLLAKGFFRTQHQKWRSPTSDPFEDIGSKAQRALEFLVERGVYQGWAAKGAQRGNLVLKGARRRRSRYSKSTVLKVEDILPDDALVKTLERTVVENDCENDESPL